MYTEKDTAEAKAALSKFILLYVVFALALLGGVVTALTLRVEWLAYVCAGFFAAGSLFLWGTMGARLVCWNRFLKEMQQGLERCVTGEIASIDEDEAVKDGLEFRAIRLFTGDETDKAGGRLLYADCSRFPLPAGVGARVDCRIFGNYVKDMTPAEDR